MLEIMRLESRRHGAGWWPVAEEEDDEDDEEKEDGRADIRAGQAAMRATKAAFRCLMVILTFFWKVPAMAFLCGTML